MPASNELRYDVLISGLLPATGDPLPNGERPHWSPLSHTLIHGRPKLCSWTRHHHSAGHRPARRPAHPAPPPGHTAYWLTWRRRHQALARWYHQRTRLTTNTE